MNIDSVSLTQTDIHKLLSAASGEAALVYLYLQAGNRPDSAAADLHLSDTQYTRAMALLRQLGLHDETKTTFVPGERPAYSEQDVMRAMDADMDFRSIYGEVQRLLGKNLNTEELKILLGFVRYLGLPGEVICVLVSYCKERARNRGSLRAPSLRTIEKEAYAWAEKGIDSLEEAAAFIRAQNLRSSYTGHLKELLQIRGRNLTPGEQRYADAWQEMGFADEALSMAYERTCLNTGGLSWAYMNRILTRWHEAGMHTAEQIRRFDRKSVPQGATGQLGQAELEAIQRLLQED